MYNLPFNSNGKSRQYIFHYLDRSLRRFDTVFPAVGSAASAIELTCDQLERCCGTNFAGWVDVCKGWQEETDG